MGVGVEVLAQLRAPWELPVHCAGRPLKCEVKPGLASSALPRVLTQVSLTVIAANVLTVVG